MDLYAQIDTYILYVRDEKRLSARTVRRYQQELRLLAQWLREHQLETPADAQREHLIQFLNRPTPGGTRLRAGSRNHKLIVLRGFFRYLKKSEVIASDPTREIPWSRSERSERPSVSSKDVAKLIAALPRHPSWQRVRNRCVLLLLFHSGLRLTELVGLTLNQVDLKRGLLLTVRRKGGHQQPIPLNAVAKEALGTWLKEREDRSGHTSAVFVNRYGAPLNSRSVQSMMRNLSERAGFSFNVTPHTLRHSFATELLRHGANLEEVRRLMGHSSITTTSRYAHPDQASLRRAVNRLGRGPKKALDP